MKKVLSIVASLLALVLVLTACSSKTSDKKEEKKEDKTIKVAAHVPPFTDMLELVKEDLQKEGYTLEIVKVSDNGQANVALANKEIDANFFQHEPFMKQYNEKNKTNLVAVQKVYNSIPAFYSKDIKNIKDLKDGADVAIPSDASNMARALRLLAHGGLITLNDPNSYNVTVKDIKDNPKHLKFTEVGLLNLSDAYAEKDLIFNYPSYIAKLNLTPMKDGLLLEDKGDFTYAGVLVAREDNKDDAKVQAVKKALTSEKIKNFLEKDYNGKAIVAF